MEALILLGGLTAHPLGRFDNFKNEIGKSGVIVNPFTIALVGTPNVKGGIIYGTDSIGKKITGVTMLYNFNKNVGVMVGSYNDNGHNKITYKINGNNVVPILGVTFQAELYRKGNFAIESATLVTAIVSTSVGLKFEF